RLGRRHRSLHGEGLALLLCAWRRWRSRGSLRRWRNRPRKPHLRCRPYRRAGLPSRGLPLLAHVGIDRRLRGGGRPALTALGWRGGGERAEQGALAGVRRGGASVNMLKRPARVIDQAAPLALLIAEPSEARLCAAGQTVIRDLLDPLRRTALRRQIRNSRPRE